MQGTASDLRSKEGWDQFQDLLAKQMGRLTHGAPDDHQPPPTASTAQFLDGSSKRKFSPSQRKNQGQGNEDERVKKLLDQYEVSPRVKGLLDHSEVDQRVQKLLPQSVDDSLPCRPDCHDADWRPHIGGVKDDRDEDIAVDRLQLCTASYIDSGVIAVEPPAGAAMSLSTEAGSPSSVSLARSESGHDTNTSQLQSAGVFLSDSMATNTPAKCISNTTELGVDVSEGGSVDCNMSALEDNISKISGLLKKYMTPPGVEVTGGQQTSSAPSDDVREKEARSCDNSLSDSSAGACKNSSSIESLDSCFQMDDILEEVSNQSNAVARRIDQEHRTSSGFWSEKSSKGLTPDKGNTGVGVRVGKSEHDMLENKTPSVKRSKSDVLSCSSGIKKSPIILSVASSGMSPERTSLAFHAKKQGDYLRLTSARHRSMEDDAQVNMSPYGHRFQTCPDSEATMASDDIPISDSDSEVSHRPSSSLPASSPAPSSSPPPSSRRPIGQTGGQTLQGQQPIAVSPESCCRALLSTPLAGYSSKTVEPEEGDVRERRQKIRVNRHHVTSSRGSGTDLLWRRQTSLQQTARRQRKPNNGHLYRSSASLPRGAGQNRTFTQTAGSLRSSSLSPVYRFAEARGSRVRRTASTAPTSPTGAHRVAATRTKRDDETSPSRQVTIHGVQSGSVVVDRTEAGGRRVHVNTPRARSTSASPERPVTMSPNGKGVLLRLNRSTPGKMNVKVKVPVEISTDKSTDEWTMSAETLEVHSIPSEDEMVEGPVGGDSPSRTASVGLNYFQGDAADESPSWKSIRESVVEEGDEGQRSRQESIFLQEGIVSKRSASGTEVVELTRMESQEITKSVVPVPLVGGNYLETLRIKSDFLIKGFLKDWGRHLLLVPLMAWLLLCLLMAAVLPCSVCFNPFDWLIHWLSNILHRNMRLIHYSPPPL